MPVFEVLFKSLFPGCRYHVWVQEGNRAQSYFPFLSAQGALLGLMKFQSGSSKGLKTHSTWANRTPSPSGPMMQWERSRHPPQSTESCDGLGYGSWKIQLKSVVDFLKEASPSWPVENKLNSDLVSGQVCGSEPLLVRARIGSVLPIFKYLGHCCPLWAVWMWGQHTELSPLPRQAQVPWFPPGFPAVLDDTVFSPQSTYDLLKLSFFSLPFLRVFLLLSLW